MFIEEYKHFKKDAIKYIVIEKQLFKKTNKNQPLKKLLITKSDNLVLQKHSIKSQVIEVEKPLIKRSQTGIIGTAYLKTSKLDQIM